MWHYLDTTLLRKTCQIVWLYDLTKLHYTIKLGTVLLTHSQREIMHERYIQNTIIEVVKAQKALQETECELASLEFDLSCQIASLTSKVNELISLVNPVVTISE